MASVKQHEHADGSRPHTKRVRERWQRMTGVLRRAVAHAGTDRDVLLLIVKSVVAATVAWVIANNVLGASSATFAPFTALLMVQATISQSLDRSARYAGAMVFGVVLAGLLTPLLGAATVTFAVLMLVALVLGRWRKLGYQGPQVGVAALFAYSSFTHTGGSPASFLQLASIAGLVVLGCTLGVLTNLVIAPPLRYRSAQYAITALSRSLGDLLTDVSEVLGRGVPGQDQAEAWLHRANQLPDMVAQARSAVSQAVENRRFNPRRLFLRRSISFDGHRSIVNALERGSEQLRSATRGLTYATSPDVAQQRTHEQFLATYAAVLSAAAEAVRVLGALHGPEDTERAQQLEDATERARQTVQNLAEHTEGQQLDRPGQWPIYSSLQTDADRLIQEFIQARDELCELLASSAETGLPRKGPNTNAQDRE